MNYINNDIRVNHVNIISNDTNHNNDKDLFIYIYIDIYA